MPRSHGLTTTGFEGRREFHFGIHSFFEAIKLAQAFPGTNKFPRFQSWSRHQIDLFVTALGKLEDTFWKIARTAELYDIARCEVGHIKPPSISAEDLAKTQQALRDIPLHLDCVLLYVRIFADCMASLTRQLFPSQNVPFRSFRDQMKWFTQKQPNVDPQYAQILKHHAGWFTTLAGDSERDGLRDLIVHRLVRTELIFQPGKTPAENRVHSFLYGVVKETTHTTQSLESLIKQMMAELFEFLDHTSSISRRQSIPNGAVD